MEKYLYIDSQIVRIKNENETASIKYGSNLKDDGG